MPDIGLTHVALMVHDSDTSAAFYERFADMKVVHRRPSDHATGDVLWISDGTRPFVVVLIPATKVPNALGVWNHLGVGCKSRDEVELRLDEARSLGHVVWGPEDDGYPVGYWGIIEDPDGHNLELSFGQEVGLAIKEHGSTR